MQLRYTTSEMLRKYAGHCAKDPEQLSEMMLDMHDVHGIDGDNFVELSDESDWEEFEISAPSGAEAEPQLSGADRECYELLAQLKAREIANAVSLEDIDRNAEAALGSIPEEEAQRLGSGRKLPPPPLDESVWLLVDEKKEEQTRTSTRMDQILTLSEVFAQVRLGPDVELTRIDPVLKPLWHCLINIRTEADRHALPNPAGFRKTTKPLNWHQSAERQAAHIRAIVGLPAKRCSRAYAWRNLASALKAKCSEEDEGQQEEVAAGTPILFAPPRTKAWRVGMILFVWRWTAKKNQRTGAKPCTMPVRKDVARYIRVCEMRPDAKNDAVFTCCASSCAVVCDVNRVGLFLHAQDVQRGIEELKIHLTDKSAQAVRQAHAWTEWPEHLMKLDDFRSAKGQGVGDFADAPKHLGGLPPRKRRRRQAQKKTTPLASLAGMEIIDDDNDDEVPSGDADASSNQPKPSDAHGDHGADSAEKQVEKDGPKTTKNKLIKSLQKKAADAIDKFEKKKKPLVVPWSILV